MNHVTVLTARISRNNVTWGKPRTAFTLAETALATLLVGMLVVGSSQSLTASFRTHKFAQSRVRATFLAEQLLIEVSALSWSDPNKPASAGTIGRDTGDPTTVVRRNQLDDMDDFDNWTEQPVARDGSSMIGVSSLQRKIAVENISAADPTVVVADNVDTGIRRITATVEQSGEELARVSGLFTRAENQLRSSSYEQRVVPNIASY